MKKLRHLDLCSGIGGFSLGLEATGGFKTIGFSEIDPWCCAVLKKHWPKVKNYGDLRTIPRIGCDIITAGFPCQPVSRGGARLGSEDDRWLWPATCNAVEASRPAWFLGENVPGLEDVELEGVLLDLEDIGYDTQPFIIPAAGVGARHLRMRIFIVAHDSRVSLEKSKVVHKARSISKSRNASIGLSRHLWKPRRETYLADMVGDVHGLSNWTHRAKALGNTVLPQIAQIFGEIILSTYEQH